MGKISFVWMLLFWLAVAGAVFAIGVLLATMMLTFSAIGLVVVGFRRLKTGAELTLVERAHG